MIHTAEFLTDRKNGDFDTKAVYCIVTPDGDKFAVNRYFAENGNDWQEISPEEFRKRVDMHNKREREEVLD